MAKNNKWGWVMTHPAGVIMWPSADESWLATVWLANAIVAKVYNLGIVINHEEAAKHLFKEGYKCVPVEVHCGE